MQRRCNNTRDSHEGTVRPFPTAAPSKLPGLTPSLSLARCRPPPPPPPRCGGRPSANIPRGFRSSICLHRPIHSSAAPSPPYMEKWVKSGAWTSSNPGHGFRPPYRLHRPLYPGGSSRRSSSASDPRILFLRFAMPLLPFLGAVNPATLAASPSLRKISRESRIFAIVVRSPVYCLLSILAPPSSLPVLPGLPLSFVRPSLPLFSPFLLRFVFSNVPFIPRRPSCPSFTPVN